MSVLQAEVYESFRSRDVPDDKALRAASALSRAMAKGEDDAIPNLKRVGDDTIRSFSKRDVDIEATRKDMTSIKDQIVGIKLDLASSKSEQAIMRRMTKFLLAGVSSLVFKASPISD